VSFLDKIYETTPTTGTGPYALDGSTSGYRGWVQKFGAGAVVFYHCQNADGSIFEQGWGVLTDGAPGTLSRNYLDSTTGALIIWAAGTKSIYCVPLGIVLAYLLVGSRFASRPGWLQAGGRYTNTTASPIEHRLWDGAAEMLLERVDETLHAVDRIAYSADPSASVGPLMELFRDSASPAASDVLGALRFTGRSATAVKRVLGDIRLRLLDATNSAEAAELDLGAMVTGVLAYGVSIGAGLRVGSTSDPGAGKIAAENDFKLGSKSLCAAEYALTDAATIAWDLSLGPSARVTLGGNRTLGAPTNGIAGNVYHLRVIQDGAGGRTLAYNAVFDWPAGVAPTVAAGSNDVSLLAFYYTGSAFLGGAGLDFS